MDEFNILYKKYKQHENNLYDLKTVLNNIIDDLISDETYDETMKPYSSMESNVIRFVYSTRDKDYEIHHDISRMRHRNILDNFSINNALYEIDRYRNEIIILLTVYKCNKDDYKKLSSYTKTAITYAINHPDNCKLFKENRYEVSTLTNPIDAGVSPFARFSPNELFKNEIDLFLEYRDKFICILSILENIKYELISFQVYNSHSLPYSQVECNAIRLCKVVNGNKYPARQTIFIHACNTGNKKAILAFLSELPKWTNEMLRVLESYIDDEVSFNKLSKSHQRSIKSIVNKYK
jgi:hypothetical protein